MWDVDQVMRTICGRDGRDIGKVWTSLGGGFIEETGINESRCGVGEVRGVVVYGTYQPRTVKASAWDGWIGPISDWILRLWGGEVDKSLKIRT